MRFLARLAAPARLPALAARPAALRRCAAARGARQPPPKLGPEPPPEWLRTLEAAAAEDDDVAELLRDAAGDAAAVEARIRERFESRRDEVVSAPSGSATPMRVTFRDVDPFNLWLWAQLPSNASADDKELLGEVLKAWFILGKLGGFDAARLRVQRRADAHAGSVSRMPYDFDDAADGEEPGAAVFHAMGDLEFRGAWARVWFDLGTSDELALDVLINSLRTFSRENVPIVQLVIGGVNPDWTDGVDAMRKQADDMR